MEKGNISQVTQKDNEEGCDFNLDREETIERVLLLLNRNAWTTCNSQFMEKKPIEDVVPISIQSEEHEQGSDLDIPI